MSEIKKREIKKKEFRHLPAFILLVLTGPPGHGGAIHAAIERMLPSMKLDTGAIYRILQRMEKSGEVAFRWETPASGPARKVYRLTEAGRKELSIWKDEIVKRRAYLNIFLKSYDRLRKKKRQHIEK